MPLHWKIGVILFTVVCPLVSLSVCTNLTWKLNNLLLLSYTSHINPFPNKPWFLRVCSTSLLKTLWEKEKLLVMSSFSFSRSVFHPFGELSAFFITYEIVVCKLFQFGKVKILSFGKGLNLVWRYISLIHIWSYQGQGHLQRSQSNTKVTLFRKQPFSLGWGWGGFRQ